MSIWDKHRANLLKEGKGKTEKAPIANAASKAATLLATLFAMIVQNIADLKNTAQEDRPEVKSTLIEQYRDDIAKMLKLDDWTDNIFVFWNIVWRFDTGDLAEAWGLVKLGIEKHLTTPDQFSQAIKEFGINQVLTHTISAVDNGATPGETFYEIFEMLEDKDENFATDAHLHAKYLKLAAGQIEETDPQIALDHYIKATKMYAGINVKGKMKKLKVALGITD